MSQRKTCPHCRGKLGATRKGKKKIRYKICTRCGRSTIVGRGKR